MEDRRQYPRISENFVINYRIQKRLIEFSSRTENISEGGACLLTAHCLETGMALDLTLKMPESTLPLAVNGTVVWQSDRGGVRFPFAIGIKFSGMDEEENKKISDYVRSKLKEQPTETSQLP
ncbi:MAG: PilZ domain-containing protein [Candidatus Omnitrophica bacterium]|nr:PilZ domain-containing protein [Candidatus Omnitrophota bacterium]